MHLIHAILLLLLPVVALGQSRPPPQTVGVVPAGKVQLGFCQLSVTTAVSVSTCSGGVPSGAAFLYMTPEGTIRWRDDGTAPTTSVGYIVIGNSQMIYSGANLSALQVIAVTGTVVVDIAFYR